MPSWSTTSPRSTATSRRWTTSRSPCKQGEIFGLLGPERRGQIHAHPHDDDAAADHRGHGAHQRLRCREASRTTARQCMGVIPQALTSDIDLTVEENLNIYAKLYGVPAEAAQAQHRRTAGDGRPAPSGATRRPRRSPAACGGGWRLRAAWYTARRFSSSTSRRPASIPSRASRSGRC